LEELMRVRELLDDAERTRKNGDVKEFLNFVKESMVSSFKACLSKLGVSADYDNTLKLYLTTPYMYRPSVGEPELEEFEFRYGLITSNEVGAIDVDERFLDASLELAERIYFWAESLTKKL